MSCSEFLASIPQPVYFSPGPVGPTGGTGPTGMTGPTGPTGFAAVAAGTTGNIQYNSGVANTFAASANLNWDVSNSSLQLGATGGSTTALTTNSAGQFSIAPTGTTRALLVDTASNVVCGAGAGLLPTGATAGLLYVPGMTGAPASSSGPTGYTGTVAHVFDVSNNMPWYLNPVNTFGGSTGATPSWVAGNGQVLIQRVILSGATGTVTFSNIPQVFNNLRILMAAAESAAFAADDVNLRFNSDNGANYDTQYTNGRNTTVSAVNQVGATSAICGIIAASTAINVVGSNVIDFLYYTNSLYYKTFTYTASLGVNSAASCFSRQGGGSWRNTGAITSITFLPGSGNLVTGSAFYLYGVW